MTGKVGKKSGLNFLKSDWFVGLLVSAVLFALGGGSLLQSLERKAYDMGVGLAGRTPSDRIAIIAIDKQSLDNIGRWPWSRDIFSGMIEKLAAAKAKVIGTTVLFSEPQRDAGLDYIDRLIALNNARVPDEADPIAGLLAEAEEKLNTDRRLAAAIGQAGNVALPMLFHVGEPIGRPDRPLPEFVKSHAVALAQGGEYPPISTLAIDAGVIDVLGSRAAAVGHLNALPDVDGAIRAEPLVLGHFGDALPALSLLIAARSLNLAPADIRVRAGESVTLGNLRIATDAATRMLPFYYGESGGKPPFPVDSFYDVASGKIPLDKYRERIVLIGPTAAGVGSLFVTPAAPAMASVEVLAHTVSSILSEHFFVAPAWGFWAEQGIFLDRKSVV